ncbi:MAG: hypothetical protein AAF889_05270 [Cyanobacteria bacterium P01_D01_bin.73]
MFGLVGWILRAIAAKSWSTQIVQGLSLLIVLSGAAGGAAIASVPLFEIAAAPGISLTPPSEITPPSRNTAAETDATAETPLPFSDPGDLFFDIATSDAQANGKPSDGKLTNSKSQVIAPSIPKPVTQKTVGQRVVAAALAKEGADVTMGPGRGLLSCAWAVNRFGLEPVLGRKVGRNPNLVVSVQRHLVKEGLATEVSQSAAQPGDIVVAAGPGRSQHIGIVVSKRSGKGVEALSTRGGRWGWRSDLNFAMKYKVKGRIYRLKNQPKNKALPRPSLANAKPPSGNGTEQNKPVKNEPVQAVRAIAQRVTPEAKPLFFDESLPKQPKVKLQSSTAVSRSLTFTPRDQTIPFSPDIGIPGTFETVNASVNAETLAPKKNPHPASKPLNSSPIDVSNVNQWFADRRSLGAVAIGHAEGNLSATGKIQSIYYGHSDPGNGVKNIGFCSLQRYLWKDLNGDGKVSFPEADQQCLDLLRGQAPKTASKLLDFGYTATKHPEATINGLDLYNQSRVAGRQFPMRYRQARDRGLTGERAVVWARVESFRVLKGRNRGKLSASGLFRICRNSPQRRNLSDWDCIASDQRRRVRAINRVVKSHS